MSDIETDEYEIMDIPVKDDSNISNNESAESAESTEIVDYEFSMNDFMTNPKTEYVIRESAEHTFSNMTGHVKYIDCPGEVAFNITTNYWVTGGLFGSSRESPVKMELTLSSNKDVSNVKFMTNNRMPFIFLI